MINSILLFLTPKNLSDLLGKRKFSNSYNCDINLFKIGTGKAKMAFAECHLEFFLTVFFFG